MSVIAYVRVSTEMQTLENQEYEILNYCRKSGLTIDRWVSESVSGTVSLEKRALGKVMRRMQKGDLIVCTELSRLGRNMLMVMSILNACSQKGVAIHTIKDGFDFSDSINSKIIAFAFALAAEIERNLISQRTKEALAVRKINGVRLGRPPGRSSQKDVFDRSKGEIMTLLENGHSIVSVAKKYRMHRNTLSRFISMTE